MSIFTTEHEPTPVQVVAPVPIPVKVVEQPSGAKPPGKDRRALPTQPYDVDPALPARTTFQEDLTFAGQRSINLIWEHTQASVALYVVIGAMLIDGLAVLCSLIFNRDMTAAQALALGFVNTTASAVISFYFSRTNHAAVGGVGAKPQSSYEGR